MECNHLWDVKRANANGYTLECKVCGLLDAYVMMDSASVCSAPANDQYVTVVAGADLALSLGESEKTN